MKKIIYIIAMMVIATVAVTSCIKPASSIKAGTRYHLWIEGGLLELCEFTVSYRDQDGTIKTDTITEATNYWEKQVIHYSDSFNEYFAYHIQLKPDVQLTYDGYAFEMYYEVRTLWPNDSTRGAMNDINTEVPRERFGSFIDSLNRTSNPVISIDVDHNQYTVLKGNKEDFELFNLNHYGNLPNQIAVDSTTTVEQEPALRGNASAQ